MFFYWSEVDLDFDPFDGLPFKIPGGDLFDLTVAKGDSLFLPARPTIEEQLSVQGAHQFIIFLHIFRDGKSCDQLLCFEVIDLYGAISSYGEFCNKNIGTVRLWIFEGVLGNIQTEGLFSGTVKILTRKILICCNG